MTEAYECDRCGELFGQPPAMKVATNNDIAGVVNVQEKEVMPRGIGHIATPQRTPKRQYNTKIKNGDLCDECAAEFREFWEGQND